MRFMYLFIISIVASALIFTASQAEAGVFKGKSELLPESLVFEKVEGFDLISFRDAGFPVEEGVPSTPFRQIHVAIPSGSVVEHVHVVDTEAMLLDGLYDLLPVSEALPISASPAKKPFQPNPALFAKNSDYPGIFTEKVSAWDLAGQDFVTLNLYPVQYNPITRRVTIMKRIEFEITYKETSGAKKESFNFSKRQKKEYVDRLKKMAFNPANVEPLAEFDHSHSKSILEEGHYEYVIIAPVYFENGFHDLIHWRSQMGMPATMVNTAWIFDHYSGATQPEMIRNFIIDANSAWGAAYFLLGGDTNYVPFDIRKFMPNGDQVPNDTYYADFDDDWKYEVFVGRVCVTSETGAQEYVDKVLTYEQNPPPDFGDTVFFMGFDLDNITYGENCNIFIKNSYVPADVVFEEEYDSEAGTHKSDVKAYMNQGFNLVNHIDHCNTTILGVGSYNHNAVLNNADARSFSNGTRYCNFYTLGCWAGNYAGSCWGENLVRAEQGGITFVGNSRSGYYSPGNTNSLSNKYDQKWWEALYVYNAYRAGETLAVSLNNYTPTSNIYKHIYAELNLLGDPGLHIWTQDPLDLEVTHKTTIDPRGQLFTVDVRDKFAAVEDACVCLMLEGDLYKVGYTLANGRAAFWIHPNAYGTLSVTVTAQNRRCYQGHVEVTTLFPQAPAAGGVEPGCGIEAGGTEILVKGRNFSNLNEMIVTIGDALCTDVTVLGPNRLSCVTPPNPQGRYDLVVSNALGSDEVRKAFLYFPTGGDPFNSTDRETIGLSHATLEAQGASDKVTLIVSGIPSSLYIAFYSKGGGPLVTPFGTAGLSDPVQGILAATLNEQGFDLVPMNLPAGWTGLSDFYIHVLGTNASQQPVWASQGNNPNGTGSIWFHLK
ncbi:MAG: C25 family cysteine peptidase [Planctomycetota bacterium]